MIVQINIISSTIFLNYFILIRFIGITCNVRLRNFTYLFYFICNLA